MPLWTFLFISNLIIVADRLNRPFGIDLPEESRRRQPLQNKVVGVGHDHRVIIAQFFEQVPVHGRQELPSFHLLPGLNQDIAAAPGQFDRVQAQVDQEVQPFLGPDADLVIGREN